MTKSEDKKKPGKPAFSNLKSLPRYPEFVDLIQRGYKPSYLANKIQKEWGGLTTIKTPALTEQIRRFQKQALSPGAVLEALDYRLVTEIRERFGDLESMMERYSWSLNAQTERIARFLQQEQEADVVGAPDPRRNPTLYKELEVQKNLLDSYKDLLFRGGVIAEMPKVGVIGLAGHVNISTDKQPADFEISSEKTTRDALHNVSVRLMETLEKLGTSAPKKISSSSVSVDAKFEQVDPPQTD